MVLSKVVQKCVIEVARQLLSMGATVDYVSKATGLPEQEIQKLVNSKHPLE